jgi:ribonuclease BN (tRNA processing enzyme)
MDDCRIVFLGTAGDTTTINKQIRASGGIILYHNGNQIHLDPGPGSLVQLRKAGINPRSTLALIASNYDIGHCNDLNAVISAMTHNGLDNRGVLIGSKSIIEGSESEHGILWKRFRDYLERNIILKIGERVGINDINLEAIPSKSKDPTGFGLKISTSQYVIAYSSDTKYQPSLINHYDGADILILKCVHPPAQEGEQTNKLNLTEVTKIIEEVRPKLAILTGFGIKMLNADPVFLAREITRQTKVQVIAAQDGLQLNPLDYTRRVEYR